MEWIQKGNNLFTKGKVSISKNCMCIGAVCHNYNSCSLDTCACYGGPGFFPCSSKGMTR